jgi:hypothetical protein
MRNAAAFMKQTACISVRVKSDWHDNRDRHAFSFSLETAASLAVDWMRRDRSGLLWDEVHLDHRHGRAAASWARISVGACVAATFV